MRPVADSPPTTSKRRLPLLILVGLAFFVLITASGAASAYTDYLWFDQLGFRSVWNKILGTQVVLALTFSAVFFLILYLNLALAERLRPSVRPPSPEEDLIERYHAVIGEHGRKLRIGISAFFALVFGLNISAEWRTWLLFRNGGDFGRVDELFQRDAGFYIFRLPFWTFLVGWLSAAVAFGLLASLVAHYLNGSIRAAAPASMRTAQGVKLHLSVLLAVLAVLRAVSYYLDRFELVNNDRGLFDGALATDVEVQLPALNLLVLISLFGAGLFVANIWRNGWGLPVVAVALWAVSHVVVGGIFPALFQRLAVEPNESTRESALISRNITATRFAYGLDSDNLEIRSLGDYTDNLTAENVAANQDIFDNVRLVDPNLAEEPFTKNQGEFKEYQFVDLDVDRYAINGTDRPVVLSVRGLNLGEAQGSWENQHVAFTHGNGAVVAAANVVAEDGLPSYVVSGLGTTRTSDGFEPELVQPRIYFGEELGGYAIVGANGRDEIDFPVRSGDANEGRFRYDGEGGVGIGSFIRQAAFALRFQRIDPLISPFVNGDSKVLFRRDIMSRVREVAPFLRLDSDPYPVITDEGGIKWIIDGYTTTNKFPYSQRVDNSALNNGEDLDGGFNYVRNSIKVVVDAYDGDVVMYVIDQDDPLAAAWAKAFPALFSEDPVPQDLQRHFRYPQDIFSVQTHMWGRYQVTNPGQFLQDEFSWSIAKQPSTLASVSGNVAPAAGPMKSQYVVTRLPQEADSEFVLQRAFVASGGERPELTALMVARSDPEHYGQLVQFPMPPNRVSAPDLVDADILKDTDISAYITPLDLQGSTVQFGTMIMVLLEDTLVYVRPLYVEADSPIAFPEFNRVIVASGNRIAFAETLEEALTEVAGGTVPTTTEPDPEPEDPPIEIGEDLEGKPVSELTGLALEFLQRADEAESNGDADNAALFRSRAAEAIAQIERVLTGG